MTAIVGTSLGDPDNPFQPLLQFLATSTKTKESSTASSTMASVIVSKELYNPLTFNALLLMNVLSMFCSIGCILLVLCLRHRPGRARKWHTQPVSIRLILYASVIDIFYSTFRIYDMIISQADTRPDSQPNCEAAMFGITFFSLLSVFIRALFSVHLHAVIVLNANRPLGYEKLFVILSFALALVLALLPLTRFAYAWIDYDPTLESGHCSYFSLESVPHSTIKPLDYTMSDARKAVIAGVLCVDYMLQYPGYRCRYMEAVD
ncbi:hypothetical protein EDC05_005662 [Coemansia umbellata]|uniref:G-protein coupled receptors family 1 profile domain-containing protein n=1 Tax=Coemansia umbellata TaxID=1424467 RepID=A0ABQ8PHM4_9FUNG|nr:hypothetical protein EDC05_005662 [Coemansia umbellata]